MRSKRTDRLELKRSLARLETENAELRSRLETERCTQGTNPTSGVQAPLTEKGAEGESLPPALTAGGYPTRAAPRTARSLKEAKQILMSSSDW